MLQYYFEEQLNGAGNKQGVKQFGPCSYMQLQAGLNSCASAICSLWTRLHFAPPFMFITYRYRWWIKVYDVNHGVDLLLVHLQALESASWMLIISLRVFNSSNFMCLLCLLLPHLTQNETKLWRVLITSIKRNVIFVPYVPLPEWLPH